MRLRVSRQRLDVDTHQRVRVSQAKANNQTTVQTQSRMRTTMKKSCFAIQELLTLGSFLLWTAVLCLNRFFSTNIFNGSVNLVLGKVKT
jgi:hypothetical protein